MRDDPAPQYAIGDFIAGEFKVLSVLGGTGKSGQGVVYLVDSADAPLPFALKTYQDLDPNAKAKFIEEAKAWVALGFHPNIVPAYWVRELDFRLFVAAEFVVPDSEGRSTLQHHILDGPQQLQRICKWIFQFCDGMIFALGRGLVFHGDVKPSNLLINSAGILRITDFGLAEVGRFRTAKSDAAGTLPYMAPEQFVSPAAVCFKADVYALGIVLYELITGGRYPYKLPANIQPEDFARLHLNSQADKLDSPFWPVLERCLSKAPSNRPSFEDVAREMRSVGGKAGLVISAIPRGDTAGRELYAKAQSLAACGEALSALQAIDEYTKRFPEYPWGWTEKGVILLHLDRIDEALGATRESLRLDSENSHAWNNLGIGLKRKQQYTEAAAAFQEALECDPYNTGTMMSLAELRARRGETKLSAELLVRALKLHPNKKTLLFNAANLAAQIMQNGGIEEAREILEHVTHGDPKDTTSWFNLALIHQSSKKTDEAIRCCLKVVDLDPTDSAALVFLAKSLAENGDFREAIVMCDRCLRLGAGREDALALKAQLLNAQGHYRPAADLLNTELNTNPQEDTLWFVLATIHETHGAFRDAEVAARNCKAILERADKRNTDNYRMVEDFLYNLHLGRGDKERRHAT